MPVIRRPKSATDLARRSGLVTRDCPDEDSVEALLVRVRHLLSLANFPSSLSELGFEEGISLVWQKSIRTVDRRVQSSPY